MSIKRIPIAIGIKPDQEVTFTNKTMSGSNNTFTNIPNSALSNSTISINGSSIPLGGNINLQLQGGSPIVDTNTTYSIKASTTTNGAKIDLDAGGSGTGTDSVKFIGAGNIIVTRVDADTIRITDALSSGASVTADNTITLTNKTISGASNTFSNIPNSALSFSSITINGTAVSLGGSIEVSGGGGGAGDVTLDGIQTLTNKIISGSNNTFSNIANSALINSSVTINGTVVPLGGSLTVAGLGDVTTDGNQVLSNKSLTGPIIQDMKILGTVRIGTAGGGAPGTSGQVLKSTGTGVTWANENQVTGSSLAIGAGLIGSGNNTEFDGSSGFTVSVDTTTVATLTGSQTLSTKTLSNCILSGTLTAGGSVGSAGQVLVSTGAGVQWSTSAGGGSFNGPGSSTDNAIVRFDGTSGATAQNSLVTISDTGIVVAPSVGSIIPFYHTNLASFPSATTYAGAVAVSAADNTVHFASNGNWYQLAKSSEVTTSTRASFTTGNFSLNSAVTSNRDITGAYKSYLLFKITTSHAAWVRVYTSTAARTADASRAIETDPLPGSGVVAEIITTGASTQVLTPAVIGFNDEATPVGTIYLAITNRSGSNQAAFNVSLTALKLEA